MNEGELITLTIKPERWPEGCPPPHIRVRALLKIMLRQFGLRCVTIITTPEPEPKNLTPPPLTLKGTP